jgi:EmrB/QacA subfamily drug resistance transporter
MRGHAKIFLHRFAGRLRLWHRGGHPDAALEAAFGVTLDVVRRLPTRSDEVTQVKQKNQAGFTAQQRWVLGLAAAGSFMAALDALVVTTALDTLRHELSASVEALEWTVNAYGLSFAVLLMTAAALGDRFGRKRIYACGLLVFAASSAACALAPGMGWLIAGRALQGLGAAMVLPLAMALLAATFAPAQRSKALGLFSGVTGLAVLAGPVAGGAVVHGLAWQWIFWINVPFALLVAALVWRKVPESKGAPGRLDWRGAVLMVLSLLGLVWGLMRGAHDGWLSLPVLGALGMGIVLGAAFVALQRREAWDAMVPPRLFRSPVFAAGNAAGFLMTASLMGTLFFMAQFFQVVQGRSPLGAGLSMLPWTATLFFVGPVAGAMVARIGARTLVVAGLAGPQSAYALWVLPMVVTGMGVSMAMPAVQSAVLAEVEPGDIGKASGLFQTLRQLGGVLGVAVAATVFARAGGYGSAQQFSGGFAQALMACALLSLAGAAVAFRLRGKAPVFIQPTGAKV